MDFNYNNWSVPIKKTLLKNINNELPFKNDFIIKIIDSPLPVHILVKNFQFINQTKKILVSFNGAIDKREELTPPFFSFNGISDSLNIPLIAFSDPTIYISKDINISWYLGNSQLQNLQALIADIINLISTKYNATPILSGGSGGGFSSLAISSLCPMKHHCLIWNPQTSANLYYERFFTKYIQTAFPEIHNKNIELSEKIKIINKLGVNTTTLTNALNEKMDLIYLQNSSDIFHIEHHCKPFAKKHGFYLHHKNQNFNILTANYNKYIISANWGKGHAAPSRTVLIFILNKMIENVSNSDIADTLACPINTPIRTI